MGGRLCTIVPTERVREWGSCGGVWIDGRGGDMGGDENKTEVKNDDGNRAAVKLMSPSNHCGNIGNLILRDGKMAYMFLFY